MFDPNMQIALGLGLGQGLACQRLELPVSLVDVGHRVNLVEAIDKPLLVDSEGVPQ